MSSSAEWPKPVVWLDEGEGGIPEVLRHGDEPVAGTPYVPLDWVGEVLAAVSTEVAERTGDLRDFMTGVLEGHADLVKKANGAGGKDQ